MSQDRVPADEVRVVALRTDDQLVEARLQFESDTDGRQLTATFPNVELKQLKEIKLQHRPYAWVEFRNVVIRPNDNRPNPAKTAAERKLTALGKKSSVW